jgi:hypothetical protein
VHASIWKFRGDPGDLLRRYDAMMGEIGAGNMRLHLCLRASDGIVLVDTCPSAEAYEAFAASEAFRALRERHGLPEPAELQDFAVHIAYAGGSVLHSEGAPAIRADAADGSGPPPDHPL